LKPIETDRLVIRPFEESDLDAVYRVIWSDSRVAGPFAGRTRPLEETRLWLAAQIWRVTYSQAPGCYAVARRQDGSLIGLYALSIFLAGYLRLECDEPSPFNSLEVELGYAIGSAWQRQGYAVEAGRAMIRHAFEELRIRRLISGADEKANAASHHLAKKLGFRMVRNLHPDWPGMVGVLDNPAIQTADMRSPGRT